MTVSLLFILAEILPLFFRTGLKAGRNCLLVGIEFFLVVIGG